MDVKRPDPDALLQQIKNDELDQDRAEKKGRLKIFLGYCAGVGKTYRMLEEAGFYKKNGIDLVVGIAETHGRKETEALLAGLEVIPRKRIEYSGITIDEMDTDAILKRRPGLVAVDELAHTNAPGSRHAKRYQDVEELLNAGINVFATLNIQHVESLNDIVEKTSGIKVRETVPEKILEHAHEVELVDLTPEKLLERLREGKVYFPEKAEQAVRRFFKKGNLLALREMSLNYTAWHVGEDMRLYMQKNSIQGPWPVGSRLLVGISASPTSERLLRFTHRLAQDLNAEWFAAFVESAQQLEINEKKRIQLDKNIRMAEDLGAQVVSLNGDAIADEMLQFARSRNVTLIVAGPSQRTRTQEIFKGSVVKELVRKSGPINVLIVGESEGIKPVWAKYSAPRKMDFRSYAISLLALAFTVGICWLLRTRIEPINIGMILLLPAIASGLYWGIPVGLFTSVLAVAAFDFFFIPPYFTFQVSDVRYLPSFLVFILVSAIISFLAKSLRQEAERSLHRERFVYSLYSFSRTIMAAEGLEQILARAVKNISEAFEKNVAILLPDAAEKLQVAAKDKEAVSVNETEQAVAAWVFHNGQPAGRGTNTLSSSAWYFLPLQVRDKVIGVIGLKAEAGPGFLAPEQNQLFESFASVVALAVSKIHE